MSKRMLALIFILHLGLSPLLGKAHQYGLGLIFIEPTGLTGKIWLTKTTALAAAMGWSSLSDHYLHLHVDYLFYKVTLHVDRSTDFSFYLGAGGKIIFQERDNAWLRFPLGIDFLSQKSPINVFFEVAPSFNFSKLDLVGAIGLRYTFSP
ncbi:MAG: hypothetical protein ACUVV5_00415 [Candidatus Aminicenantales bacterium]